MAIICPSVTAENPHAYREQMDRVAPFAARVHIDVADGMFTPNRLITPLQVWWPFNAVADVHLMYYQPAKHLAQLIKLKPQLVIIHAEAKGDFFEMADRLHTADIAVGVALLEKTPTGAIEPALDVIDHVLIFSGQLGRFGGKANLDLLDKVKTLKRLKPALEIGWDGGINNDNAAKLVKGGVDVLNVGGFIQRAPNPAAQFAVLTASISSTR